VTEKQLGARWQLCQRRVAEEAKSVYTEKLRELGMTEAPRHLQASQSISPRTQGTASDIGSMK
jgi:hypothetical protein